jgi:uncharacterized membrane protein YhaH (DUF805 family)
MESSGHVPISEASAPGESSLARQFKFLLWPNGRIGRVEMVVVHLLYTAFLGVIYLAALWVVGGGSLTVRDEMTRTVGLICLPALLIYFYCDSLLLIKRLHDVNLRGWFSLLLLIPFLGILFVLFPLVVPGTRGPNRFGIRQDWTLFKAPMFISFLLVAVPVLGLCAIFFLPNQRAQPVSESNSGATPDNPTPTGQSSSQPISADALYQQGLSFEKGTGGAQDYKQAFDYYQKAASLGNTLAMVHIGYLYEGGNGVIQDFNQAELWYEKAAALGDAQAMTEIGVLYQNRSSDYSHAMEWYQKAAAAGNSDAQYCIGNLYEKGLGVDSDEKAAVVWYQRAAAQGDTDSIRALKRLGYSQ